MTNENLINQSAKLTDSLTREIDEMIEIAKDAEYDFDLQIALAGELPRYRKALKRAGDRFYRRAMKYLD